VLLLPFVLVLVLLLLFSTVMGNKRVPAHKESYGIDDQAQVSLV
jgi:hypothetical protein